MEKLFKLTNGYIIVCETKNRRDGFSHIAELFNPEGYLVDKTSIKWYNRTWERWEYQKVIYKIINKNFKVENPEQLLISH